MGASPWSFTLVELLLVIIIVGILIGLSTPVFKNSYTDFQLSDTASGFASLMRFAQVSAATERARFRINFDTERSRYWLTKATGPNEEDEFLRIQGKFGRTIVSPQKIKIETSQDEITFYPDGRADEVVIYFSSPGNKFYTCLTEGETGYVRLLDYKAE